MHNEKKEIAPSFIYERASFYSDLLSNADMNDEQQSKSVIIEFFRELQKDRVSGCDDTILPYDKEIQQPFGRKETLFSTYLNCLTLFRKYYQNGEYKAAANELFELNYSEPCFLRGTREGLLEAGRIVLGSDFP